MTDTVSMPDRSSVTDTVAIAQTDPSPHGRRRGRRRGSGQMLSHLGGAVVVATIAAIIAVHLWSGFDPYAQDLASARLAPFADPAHPLGTDAIGRDLLSRLAAGGKTTLWITAAVIALNMLVGTVFGLLAGFFGGWLDNVVALVTDVSLAMPAVLLLIALSAIFGPSALLMILVLGFTHWMSFARLARATALSLRNRDFVLAPQMLGASSARVIRTHILPHVVPQMLIVAVTSIGSVILLQAGLDYLGLGIQPPDPTWGGLVLDGQKYLRLSPWQAVLPGIAIFLVVGGAQFLSQRYTAENTQPLRKVR
ncbi:peptide/nickel transport system permease protein [Microbacterium sp. W4I4]|uniref:ABC transporter permease n=1 Tax=Microbacterium sp. W4I4 TaxID=3042295 RepID=UPI0027874A7B|nr:ABC transporter permease [Microbacterium sp. W4I4]MDQ0613581.1 peptide/nickel transport system permease protein [Microbacterium sp. W4I4]